MNFFETQFWLTFQDYDGDEYSTDNSGGHIVDDGTSHLSPLDETASDHLHGHVEYIDNHHSNRSGNSDHIGSSSGHGGEGSTPDIDLENGQSNPNIDPDNEHHGENSNVNMLDQGSDSGNQNLHVQDHLPVTGSDVLNSSSARQGHVEAIDNSRSNRNNHYVINAVGRAVHNINVTTLDHPQPGPALTGDQDHTNTSERPQVHHGFLMGGDMMVNTSDDNKAHHGFLMGGDVQNMDNEHNTLTTRHPTSPQSAIPSSTTTTPESFITVRLSNMSSHELTESSSLEPMNNNDIVIDRTDQTSGRRGNGNQDSQIGHANVNNGDKESTTEASLISGEHIATLPGEPSVHEHDHENGENLNGHEETDTNGQGVDELIDKGEHQHNDNNEENNEPGHTSNPVARTPQRPENLPATETTTPNLIILPTPANLEPEEREPSTYIQEPQSTVTVHGGDTEPIEPIHEGQGESGESSGIHGNNEEGNNSQETHTSASEGNIEFVTELPGNEFKPNKHFPKYSAWKSEDMSSLVSTTTVTYNSERFVSGDRSIEAEVYSTEIWDRNSITKTEQPEPLPSSTVIYSDMKSTQTDSHIYSTVSKSKTEELLFPSQSFLPEQSNGLSKTSTHNFQETTPSLFLETSLTHPSQDIPQFTQTKSANQHTIPSNNISPSKTVDGNTQWQSTESSIPVASIAPTKSISKSSSNMSPVPSSDIKSSTPLQVPEAFTSSTDQVYTDTVLHTSQVYASTNTNTYPSYSHTENALHTSVEHSSTDKNIPTSRESLYSSTDLNLQVSPSTTNHLFMQSSQGLFDLYMSLRCKVLS